MMIPTWQEFYKVVQPVVFHWNGLAMDAMDSGDESAGNLEKFYFRLWKNALKTKRPCKAARFIQRRIVGDFRFSEKMRSIGL